MVSLVLTFLASHGWALLWISLVATVWFALIEHCDHSKAIADALDQSSRKKAVWKRRFLWMLPGIAILQAISSQVGSDLTEARLAPVKLICIDTNIAMAHEKGWEARLTFQNMEMEKALTILSVHAEADDPVIAEITIGNATLSSRNNNGSHDPSLKVMDAKGILPNPPNCSIMVRVKKPTTVRLTSPNFDGEKVLVIR